MATLESTHSSPSQPKVTSRWARITEGVCVSFVGEDDLFVTRRTYPDGSLFEFEIEGALSKLIEIGILRSDQIPVGNKRVASNTTDGSLYKMWHCRVKRIGSARGLVRHYQPPENIASLCELLMKGIVIPPAVLGMAWSPGAVEGPVRAQTGAQS